MPNRRAIAFSATDPEGRAVIAYETTMATHRLKHPEPFSDEDVVSGIEEPDMIAESGHGELDHKDRLVYYKERAFDDAPPIMKVVVEHRVSPGIVTSAFRTSKFSKDGVIVYVREGYYEEKLNANRKG